MAEPPSYEESTSGLRTPVGEKADRKTYQPCSFREQVGLSRTQHVASVVSQVVENIRERALQGLSKTTLILIPSDQDASRKGELVGFPDDDMPTIIQSEGRQNSMQFWQQEEALSELKEQLRNTVSDGMPAAEDQRQAIQEERPPAPPKKTSWFGRKSSKAPEVVQQVQPPACPVEVDVQLDEIYFRSESEYGLYETLRVRVVAATVNIR